MTYKKKYFKSTLITITLLVGFYVVMELLMLMKLLSSNMQGLLVPICYYMIAAASLNLVVGISGELSLGHAGFMCIGAFTSALFSQTLGKGLPSIVELILAIIIGALFAALFGFIIGIPVLRLKGDYLAIVTLAFGEIIKNILNAIYIGVDSKGYHFSLTDAKTLNLEDNGDIIVKGAQGFSKLPRSANFTISIILVIITVLILSNIVYSRYGRAIKAARDNRIAADCMGIDVSKYKLLAFVISAALAGIAGVLYSHNLSSLQFTSKNFGYNQSIMILVFVVLGGIGNIRGSLIAAAILTILPEKLRFLSGYRMLIYAVVLIVIMLASSAPKAVEIRKNLIDKILSKKANKNKTEEVQ